MIIKDKKVEKIIKDNQKEKHKLKHIVSSFFYGGVIGMFAQGLYEMFFTLLNIDEKTSTTLTSGVIVFIAFLLTCLGVFDKLSNIAYLGVIIPISGFANSITTYLLLKVFKVSVATVNINNLNFQSGETTPLASVILVLFIITTLTFLQRKLKNYGK